MSVCGTWRSRRCHAALSDRTGAGGRVQRISGQNAFDQYTRCVCHRRAGGSGRKAFASAASGTDAKDRAIGKRSFKKPRICVCVPSGATEVEIKAVQDAAFQAGAREVFIVEEPVAAAIGAAIDISKPCGNMIVDIGGGTTDVAVISLGGTVVSTSIKVAGDDFDDAIVRYMRKKHNLLIGDRTAEEIKIGIGTCFNKSDNKKMEVRGRNLVTGLPKTIEITSEETEEALKDVSASIVEAVHRVLEQTPPELAADIAVRGIVLTGGGCLLHGLDQLIESKTGINTMTAEDPMTVVAIGTGQYLDYIDEAAKEKIN